uniref:Prostaglandin D2 receptor n=1 Tax=Chelonoidis abingdonii TaxID=106734 RepID=A0A8C0H217_CHEAB
MAADGYRCRDSRAIQGGESALPSSLLFSAGLLGNLLALLLLGQQRLRRGRPPRASAFYLLVSGLAVTDLLGKCLLSPMVLAAYAGNRSLSELGPGGGDPGRLCQLFAFLMAFFGLAPTLLLLAMALECCLSLGHPYFYRRQPRRRPPRPALGPARRRRLYCPGTWCFIRMAGGSAPARGYSVLYASLLGALVLAIGLCNLASMRSLYRMARRPHRRSGPTAAPRMEELDHLVLLALMTVLFTVCSLPLIVRAYVGAFAADFNEKADLTALRFLSVNSIVDPWVFIIFRTSVFRKFFHRVCRRLNSKKAVTPRLASSLRPDLDSEINRLVFRGAGHPPPLTDFTGTTSKSGSSVRCGSMELGTSLYLRYLDGPDHHQLRELYSVMDSPSQHPCEVGQCYDPHFTDGELRHKGLGLQRDLGTYLLH